MNNNITPANVTYEQAVWLKSIGFGVPCLATYTQGARGDGTKIQYLIEPVDMNQDPCVFVSAPEQSVVVEWLRVNFGVWIYVRYSYKWEFYIERIGGNTNPIYNNGLEDSPSEAISAAFSYLMSNEIIKQK